MKSIYSVVLGLSCAHLALGGAHGIAAEESSRELMALSKPLRLPKVPPVHEAGADGLPELPQVQALVGSFLKEESTVNTEEKKFYGRTMMIEKEEMKKLERLKIAYDQKLKLQEKNSQALVKTNAGLAKEVMAQNRANEQLRVQLKRIDERIKARRQQLQALEQRFLDGRKFMKSVLAKSDDSNEMSLLAVDTGKGFLGKAKAVKEVTVETRQETAKEPELLEQEEENATKNAQENQMSFIEINSKTQTVNSSPASQASLVEGLANLVNNQLKKTINKAKTGHKRALRQQSAVLQSDKREPVAVQAQEQAPTPAPELDVIDIPDFSAVEELAQVDTPTPKARVQPPVQAQVQPPMLKAQVQPPMPKVQAQPPIEAQPPILKAEAQLPMSEVQEQELLMPEAMQQPAMPEAIEQPAMPEAQEQPAMPEAQVQPAMPEAQVQPAMLETQLQPPAPVALATQPPTPQVKLTEADVMKAKEDADSAADDKFINSLRERIRTLRASSKMGEEALKAKFQDGYKVGAIRQKALHEQQTLLKASLNALVAKGRQLRHAETVLKDRLAGLESNLKQGGALLGGLAKVVTARVEDVPKTIETQAVAAARIVDSAVSTAQIKQTDGIVDAPAA